MDSTQQNLVTWEVRSLSTGKLYPTVGGSLNDDFRTPLMMSIPKAEAGLLRIKAIVSYPKQVVIFVLEGPYGTINTFTPGSLNGVMVPNTGTSFGQYLNTPLCNDGVQVYQLKGYNTSGERLFYVELLIDLTVGPMLAAV